MVLTDSLHWLKVRPPTLANRADGTFYALRQPAGSDGNWVRIVTAMQAVVVVVVVAARVARTQIICLQGCVVLRRTSRGTGRWTQS